jgi:F0F1-type ATP synthase membrane subunit b/b'
MIALGRLMEVAVMVVLLVWIVTQILIPLVKGTHLFPIFSKRRNQLEDRLETVKTRAEEADYERQIEALNRKYGRHPYVDWRDDDHED